MKIIETDIENIKYQEPDPILTVNKWKFITWLFIISIIMLFASQTSAYIVRRAEGNWVEFDMPTIFYYSTAVLVFSSIFLMFAMQAAKTNEFKKLRLFISLSVLFGISFLFMQYEGWKQLQALGIYLKGNPSGSFFYVLTGLHAFHLISGIIVLLFAFYYALKMRINSKHLERFKACAMYWHFLDILWVYLFIFLIYFR